MRYIITNNRNDDRFETSNMDKAFNKLQSLISESAEDSDVPSGTTYTLECIVM